MQTFDVRVNGAGIVGKTLALALGRLGLSVALRGASGMGPNTREDVRAYALNAGSVELLRSLKVWDGLAGNAATAVHDMQVHGDAPSWAPPRSLPFAAPRGGAASLGAARREAVLEFSAWEQRVGELAVITDAAVLEHELDAALRFAPHVTRVDSDVAATLVAHCEGRAAAAVAGLDAGFERFDYGQRAIAARLVATAPHRHVARQWFAGADVLALLPFDRPEPSRSYALVWSLPNERAEALLAADIATFEAALAEATQGSVGGLSLASERAAWPLVRGQAERWCGPGWVLLGDAAHTLHPLAGQGLNLGLADVAALASTLAQREPWRTVGDERLLRRYVRQRAAPTWAMLRITDGLQRLFAAPGTPLKELRNNGMTLVNRLPPLKRWLTARALDS